MCLNYTSRRHQKEGRKVNIWCKDPEATTRYDVWKPRPDCAFPKNVNLVAHKPLLPTHPSSDIVLLHLKILFGTFPAEQGRGQVQITEGTVTVPLNLQTLSEKIRFDLHDQVAMEFMSGQEITVWWQCHMRLDTNSVSSWAGVQSAFVLTRSTLTRVLMAVVTVVLMKDLHCSLDAFWKLLRNYWALQVVVVVVGVSYDYILQFYDHQSWLSFQLQIFLQVLLSGHCVSSQVFFGESSLWSWVLSHSGDIGLELSLQLHPLHAGSPPTGHPWRFTDLNVCHKTQPFMCDHIIVPPHFDVRTLLSVGTVILTTVHFSKRNKNNPALHHKVKMSFLIS